ncbi:hypothetical protein [Verrucomicrobium sp. BvORR034]|uniref:hypothetical protein n=1 Tax=Verrucomicrobium sp. BvORR034 TaxID=1396418 RepID=UPI00067874FD|nr:hypothetical protein [Verrucomicrobium sp. BvORR034]
MKQHLFVFCLALASLALLSSCCCNYNPSQVPYPVVTRLAPGQKLDLNFQSSSRYHYLVYDLTITPRRGGYRVTGVERSPSRTVTDTKVIFNHKPLLPVDLTHEDGARLDRLFEYYRSISCGGCLTVDSTHVTIRSGSRTLYQEYFMDNSCDPCDNLYMPELLSIPAIVYSMRPENPLR